MSCLFLNITKKTTDSPSEHKNTLLTIGMKINKGVALVGVCLTVGEQNKGVNAKIKLFTGVYITRAGGYMDTTNT